jgi:Glycosyl transferases group 1
MRMNFGAHRYIKVDGYGRMGMGISRALLQAGHDVYPFLVEELDMPAWYQIARGLTFDVVTIQLMPPHNMRNLPGRSVGWSMHESLALPRGWAQQVNERNQWFMVPSPWLLDLFGDAGVRLPMAVVPGGVDIEECPILPRNHHRPFTFGALGDRAGRKGNDEVYFAFWKAFGARNRDVRLLVKCRPGSMPHLDFSYSSDDRITIWRTDVEHVSDIYMQMDAFIFPSKCEGYGMPPREAAACGVPTVVQRFSGTADDCDEWAIPLEDFTLVESGMADCGGEWAQPSIDELVWRLRDIYENQDVYKARALQAAQWMRNHATYAHAAQKLVAVLRTWLGGPHEEEPLPIPDLAANTRNFELLQTVVGGNGRER